MYVTVSSSQAGMGENAPVTFFNHVTEWAGIMLRTQPPREHSQRRKTWFIPNTQWNSSIAMRDVKVWPIIYDVTNRDVILPLP